MPRRVFVIPFGFFTRNSGRVSAAVFLNRKDIYLPDGKGKNHFENKLLMFGGAVEEGETNQVALLRELSEEAPGWYNRARLTGTSKSVYGLPAESGFALLHEDNDFSIYACAVDVGQVSHRMFSNCCTEGEVAAYTLDSIGAVPNSHFGGGPPMKEAVLKLLRLKPTIDNT
jgi:hypothetical protein